MDGQWTGGSEGDASITFRTPRDNARTRITLRGTETRVRTVEKPIFVHKLERACACERGDTQVIACVVSAGQLRVQIDFLGTADAAPLLIEYPAHELRCRRRRSSRYGRLGGDDYRQAARTSSAFISP